MVTSETDIPPSDPALLAIDGAIATITLNRPATFNSIDLSVAKRLEVLAAEVEASDDIKVLVIEGAGRAFCAGGDLQTLGAAAAADTIAPVVGELLHHYHAFIAALRRMPKIVLSPACTARLPAPVSRSPSWPISASRLKTRVSRRPTPSSACRRTAAARSA